MVVSVIVAMTESRVIGVKNQIPWHIPDDLKRFKQITMGKPVIMGRKTYDSIGRLLPGRQNIIITRQTNLVIPGATIVSSLDEAFNSVKGMDEVFIIGGAEIYSQSIERADKIYLTIVHAVIPNGEAFFPNFDESKYEEVSRELKSIHGYEIEYINLQKI